MFWSRIVHCPSSTTPRDVLTSRGTSSHDTDGIDTDLFGLSAVARHTRRACLGQDALKLCTELGFGLAGGGQRAKQRLNPPTWVLPSRRGGEESGQRLLQRMRN